MNTFSNRIAFLGLMILFSFNAAFSQDKNVLAKVAYENAEEAFSAGNMQEAIIELNMVDKLLGTTTPKSKYLRVQACLIAAEKNLSLIDSAVKECQSYLALAKQHEIAEEKVMEVTRSLVKLEKQKIANLKAVATKKIIVRVVDSLLIAFNVRLGATEEEFRKQNSEAFKEKKRKQITTDYFVYEPRHIKNYGGLGFKNNKLVFYQYFIEAGNEKEIVDHLFQTYVHLFPEDRPKEYGYVGEFAGNNHLIIQGRGVNDQWVYNAPGNWQVHLYVSPISASKSMLQIHFQLL